MTGGATGAGSTGVTGGATGSGVITGGGSTGAITGSGVTGAVGAVGVVVGAVGVVVADGITVAGLPPADMTAATVATAAALPPIMAICSGVSVATISTGCNPPYVLTTGKSLGATGPTGPVPTGPYVSFGNSTVADPGLGNRRSVKSDASWTPMPPSTRSL